MDFPQEITDLAQETGQDDFFSFIRVSPDQLMKVLQSLKGTLGMNYLANLTAVDLNDEFELIYHLYAIPDNGRKVAVKARVPRNHPEIASVVAIYPTADWQEREVFDLMGINFQGHPNLIRILLPDDYEGHPLRKDFKKEG